MCFFVSGFGINFSKFTFVGELLMTLWLLIKGVNVGKWGKRTLEAT